MLTELMGYVTYANIYISIMRGVVQKLKRSVSDA
jgi:hypothetical protein